MTMKNVWRGVFALLLIAVTWLTLTPDPEDTETGFAIARFIAETLLRNEAAADKVAHFLVYAALGATAVFADLRLAGRRLAAAAALAAYGGALEFVQGAGGVRVADPGDALANAGGAFAACIIATLIERMTVSRRLA